MTWDLYAEKTVSQMSHMRSKSSNTYHPIINEHSLKLVEKSAAPIFKRLFERSRSPDQKSNCHQSKCKSRNTSNEHIVHLSEAS